MRALKLIIYLFFLLTVQRCKKETDENIVISFDLDGKYYYNNSGFATHINDKEDYYLLFGQKNGKRDITIKYKNCSKDFYSMPNDTFFVNINIGSNVYYRVSNWPEYGFHSSPNNKFNLTINYSDENKISGVFNGTLYYVKDFNAFIIDTAILTNGKFDLVFNNLPE